MAKYVRKNPVLPETKDTLAQVALALDNLNQALDTELAEMQRAGVAPAKIEHVRAGARAIRDCGNMLLVWSDYIARGELSDHSADPESAPDQFPR
jgi:4-hydroxyphenylpyruvate dioxygenase-like putative hemolysin